jgi:hypothetical protein
VGIVTRTGQTQYKHFYLKIGSQSRSVVQSRVIQLVKVRFAQDLDSAILPLAKQLSSGNNALHTVYVKETIKNAAHAALHKQSAFAPRAAPSRLSTLTVL